MSVKRVLIYECAGGHGECLPPYYAYFEDLGYDVTLIIDRKVDEDKPLWMFNNPKVHVINTPAIKHLEHIREVSKLGSNVFKYDLYFIATLNKHTYPFIQYLLKNRVESNKILFQNHLNTQYFLEQSGGNIGMIPNGFVLTHSPDFPSLPPIRNTTGLTKQPIKDYFDKLNILITGLDKIHFAYFDKFIQTVDKLNEIGYDIKVKVTGIRRRGDYVLPESKNLTYCGRVNFEELTNLYVSNDFLMTFFDVDAVEFKSEHHSFLKGRTSGSRNQSVIYGIPLIVQKPFQSGWDLNDTNSVSYEGTDYKTLLISLFNMTPMRYNSIIKHLLELQYEENAICFYNLRKKINDFAIKTKPLDLVYIVKPGDNNEDLKYSLRSVAKFVPHNKIWIVGYKPKWVQNVGYIPVAQKGNKWVNSVANIIAACKNNAISENFILMNDDFFAVKPITDIFTATNLSLGLLSDEADKQRNKTGNSRWAKAFVYVEELLESLGVEKPYYNYESHTPLLINRIKYLEVMNMPLVQEFMTTAKVLHKRTLYKNIDKIKPTFIRKDVKILPKEDDTNDRKNICGWLSVYDGQVGDKRFKYLNDLLLTLFPRPCKYEVSYNPSTEKSSVVIPAPQPGFRQTQTVNMFHAKYF